MGIQGLLPFLKPSSTQINIAQYSGCVVAIDAYCWLHKGAFSCAEKLARGEETDMYVYYCIKYVNMLLSHNIKPILVFDGRHLPAKAETEKIRRQRREINRRKAAELLRLDRGNEAKTLIQRCVDVTHDMALALIKKCHELGVDCIVAPFEADAQLAYLSINKMAHIIITEDSDLLLFGCTKVLFKMDVQGNGILVEQEKLPLSMKERPEKFTMDRFRYMCILSGCDYLSSLPGIGLQKAFKFIKKTAETNMSKALTRLGAYLNMNGLVVGADYIEKFLIADAMFKHQPVFDPISRKVVPLTPLPEGQSPPVPDNLPEDVSFQLALGNLNPFTSEQVNDWDPDEPQNIRSYGWNSNQNRNSIWSKDYKIPKPLNVKETKKVDHDSTKRKAIIVQPKNDLVDHVSKQNTSTEDMLKNLRAVYGVKSPPLKKICLPKPEIIQSVDEEVEDNSDIGTLDDFFDEPVSPDDDKVCSPVQSQEKERPIKFGKVKKTIIDENLVVQSRFFSDINPVQRNNEFDKAIDNIINISSSQTPSTSSHDSGIESSQKENDFDLSLERIVQINVTPKKDRTKTHSKNPFSTTPEKEKISDDMALYKRFSKGSERQSFLKVIDSVSKVISEDKMATIENKTEKPSTSFPFSKIEKQDSISNFLIKSPNPGAKNLNTNSPKTLTKNPPKVTLKKAKVIGLKRKKPKITPSGQQPSIFEMFAFQPKDKLKT